MKKLTFLAQALVALSVVFMFGTGCNQISTVGKITGTWNLTSLSGTNTYFYRTVPTGSGTTTSSDETTVTTYDGTTQTVVSTTVESSGTSTSTTTRTDVTTMSVSLDIRDDGTYTSNTTSTPVSTTTVNEFGTDITNYPPSTSTESYTGTWTWGNADKSNSRIMLDGMGSFVIQESKKDQLVLIMDDSWSDTDVDSYSTVESNGSDMTTWTFAAQ